MKQFLDHMKAAGRTDDPRYVEITEKYLNSLYEQAKRPVASPIIIDLVNESDSCPSSFKRLKVKIESGVKSDMSAAASPANLTSNLSAASDLTN